MSRVFEFLDDPAVYSLVVTHASGAIVRLGPWCTLTAAKAMRTRYLKHGTADPYSMHGEYDPAKSAVIERADNWTPVDA